VVEIQGIVTVINQMLEISTAIASAVEEQGTATQEIARNVQMAAQGTEEVRTQITGLQRDVSDTDGAASEVLSTAERLARNSELLKTNVTNFLRHIRTA
jgi:methyl-accepting chemotaxis protein